MKRLIALALALAADYLALVGTIAYEAHHAMKPREGRREWRETA